jgi:hypothetical protein
MSIAGKTVKQVLGNPQFIYPDASDFGWRDITGQVLVRGVAATDPAWSQIGSSPFSAYKFDVNDFVWFIFHIPHDIVPGADIHFHAHWLTDGTNTAVVKWEWTYMYAKGFNQGNFNVNGTVITAEQAAANSAYRHMVTETVGVSIPGLTEPDGIVYVRLRRVTNGATDNTDGIFLLTSDIHYQTTDASTVDKAPNFYVKST